MFGFGLRPFEEDPFFRDHHERMHQMFAGFGRFDRGFTEDPFAVEGPHNGRPREDGNRVAQGPDRQLAPMGMMGTGMFGMVPMFHNMEEQFARVANNPNTFSYSQSSVMSYSNDGSGEPKYFQAHHSTKRAPGGIKETRNAVSDSESGLQRMAVGHHIGDRGHVVERSVNRKTGHEERNQDFLNMDEENVDNFQEEWTRRTRLYGGNQVNDRQRHRHRALPDSSHGHGRHDRPRERPQEHDRERRIRHHNRPRNRHAPREGLD